MPDFPRGTVTFLFTDIEQSTVRWELNRTAMAAANERHIVLLRQAIEPHGGHLFKVIGDAVQAAFHTAPSAVMAALAGQRAVQDEDFGDLGPLQIRMALHAGEATPDERGDYLAAPLNRLSRLLATGYGGQVLVSNAVQQLTRDDLPPQVSLMDLGEHWLRDLVQPERIFQLLHPGLHWQFPPLKTGEQRRGGLLRQPNPFLGRTRELEQILELLHVEDTQLVTLTGAGGIGKTRLAIEVAERYAADRIIFVPLASLTESSRVLHAVAEAARLREISGKPLHEQLCDAVLGKSTLLVLDNFEHLIEAAPTVGELLAHCPSMKALVTSRAALRLRAERVFPVPTMGLPIEDAEDSPTKLGEADAIRLFTDRAQAANPRFELTVHNAATIKSIVCRLDGLPLALELAAARLRGLSPEALLSRLENKLPILTGGARDAPARHRTMRATIDWSHDLLKESERALFRRLGVFANGWTLEAAEGIVNVDENINVFETLESLVEQSLIVFDERGARSRYGMLETIREFAFEQLQASGDTPKVSSAHAQFFVNLAEQAETQFSGPNQVEALDQLSAEHENLRLALGRVYSDDPELGQKLSALLWWFWWVRGHLSEGRQWLERGLAIQPKSTIVWRSRALFGVGTIAEAQGDYGIASSWHSEALDMNRAAGDERATAKSLESLGDIQLNRGNPELASRYFAEALELSRSVGDQQGIAHALMHQGAVASYTGRAKQATALFEQALAGLRSAEDRRGIAAALTELGTQAADEGAFERSVQHLEEAEPIWRELGEKQSIALVLANLGEIAARREQFDDADRLNTQALEIFQELGDKASVGSMKTNLAQISIGRCMLQAAVLQLREGLVLLCEVGNQEAVTENVEIVAALAAHSQQYRASAKLLGAVESARKEIGAPVTAGVRNEVDAVIAILHSELSESEFSTAWTAGQEQVWDQTIAEALSLLSDYDLKPSSPK